MMAPVTELLPFFKGYRAQYKTLNISGEHRSLPAHMLKVYMYIYMHTYCSVCVTVLHVYILQYVRYRVTCIHIAVCQGSRRPVISGILQVKTS